MPDSPIGLGMCLSLAAVVLVSVPSLANEARDVGPGQGTLVLLPEADCGNLVTFSDGSYENAYTWSYGGIVPPDYGAFAECYEGPARICSAFADLTSIVTDSWYLVDVYVYDDDSGTPGAVLAASLGNDPGPLALWPEVGRHVFPIETDCFADRFYIAVWWDGSSGFDPNFLGADLDGFGGGCTLTKIAPGIGFPTGWQNVSLAWGPTTALGLGAELVPCEPTPTIESSWGKIKSYFDE